MAKTIWYDDNEGLISPIPPIPSNETITSGRPSSMASAPTPIALVRKPMGRAMAARPRRTRRRKTA